MRSYRRRMLMLTIVAAVPAFGLVVFFVSPVALSTDEMVLSEIRLGEDRSVAIQLRNRAPFPVRIIGAAET